MHRRRIASGFARILSIGILLSVVAACGRPAPAFQKIGVVEGYYGTPWSHEARLDMVRFMGRAGFTHYIYAPKDDPYHRSRWREPYPEPILAQFRELVASADSAGITLVFAVSPGLNIVYSDSADVGILHRKLLDMRAIGFREAALFLDDVPEHLQHPADQERFSDLAAAHVHLVNAIRDGLDLMVCPTTYTSAWGDPNYVEALSRGIGKEVPLFWTGRDVAPSSIPLADVRYTRLRTRGPLYLWDNFPVNDFETWRPLLGALKGRDPKLPKMVDAIFANPMESVYLSMIPLRTVARYARNPDAYDPEEALEEAIRFVLGDAYADSVRPFVHAYASAGWEDHLFTGIYAPGAPIDSIRVDSIFGTWGNLPEFTDPVVRRWMVDLAPYMARNMADWRSLTDSPRQTKTVTDGQMVRFANGYWTVAADGDTLSIRVKVVGPGKSAPIVVVLTPTTDPTQRWLTPQDLLIRYDPASGTLETGHLALTEFSARGISDIRLNRISSFFAIFWKPDATPQARLIDGVIRVGKPVSDRFRLNVMVSGMYQAAEPGMFGNPWTYPIWEPKP
jgi:hypothetical protein